MRFNKIKDWLSAHSFKISIVLILGGFVLMSIGNSGPNEGNSLFQLTIAPILLLMGYSLIIFAIMNRKNC